MFRRRSALRRCPLCGSEGVSAWDCEETGDGLSARVLLRCAECGTSRQVVATLWAIDAYARRHERQRCQIEDALRRLERLGPDEFIAPRVARART